MGAFSKAAAFGGMMHTVPEEPRSNDETDGTVANVYMRQARRDVQTRVPPPKARPSMKQGEHNLTDVVECVPPRTAHPGRRVPTPMAGALPPVQRYHGSIAHEMTSDRTEAGLGVKTALRMAEQSLAALRRSLS